MELQQPSGKIVTECGILYPVRCSNLSDVYAYHHDPSGPKDVIEDQRLDAHGFVVTTAGCWEYRGQRGSADVSRGVTVAGVLGRHFGCRHVPGAADSNLVVGVRPGALDNDEQPPFDIDILQLDLEPAVRRALSRDDDDAFESALFEVLDWVAMLSQRSPTRPHGYMRMQRLKRFIEWHATEAISISDIATYANISPFTLIRQFKAHVGLTPHNYIDDIRLRRAKQLLSRRHLSIGSVSRRVGFPDQRYFSRWFAKATGFSPRTFRR